MHPGRAMNHQKEGKNCDCLNSIGNNRTFLELGIYLGYKAEELEALILQACSGSGWHQAQANYEDTVSLTSRKIQLGQS